MQLSFGDLGVYFSKWISRSGGVRWRREEGGGIATTLRCPNINKSRLTAGNRGQQVPWYRRFVGKTSVSLVWQVLGQQWHTPVKGCFRTCTLDLE